MSSGPVKLRSLIGGKPTDLPAAAVVGAALPLAPVMSGGVTQTIAQHLDDKVSSVALDVLYSEIPGRVIPLRSFRIAGNAAPGDLGAGALYVRGTTGPRKITDALGTSFVLVLEGGVTSAGYFGAVGDGVTDDRVAINDASAAVLAANGGKGIVLLPAGTFLINSSPGLTLPSGLTLRGVGRTASVLKLGTAINGLNSGAPVRADVTIEGVCFSGRRDTTGASALLGFSVSSRIVIKHSRFENNLYAACAMGPAVDNSGFIDVDFVNCGYFIATNNNAPAYLFHGKLAADTDEQAVAKNHHNFLKDCRVRDGMSGTCSRQSYLAFTGNDMITRGSAGAYFSNCFHYEIGSNFFSAIGTVGDGSDGGNGLDIYYSASGIIHGNTLYGCGGAGIMLAGDSYDTQVIGNKCVDNGKFSSSLHRGGICIDRSLAGTAHDGIIISGNDCYDTRAGIANAVTQANAIGINGSVGTVRNLRITNDNMLRGYGVSTGGFSPVNVFQNTNLPVVEFPQHFNMATGATRELADAAVTGTLSVFQYNNQAPTKIVLQPSTGAAPRTPIKESDPANQFVVGATNSGTTSAVYTTTDTLKHVLANNTGVTRYYIVSITGASRFA